MMFSQTIAESAETIRVHAELLEQAKVSLQQLTEELTKRDRDVDRDLTVWQRRLNRHRVDLDRNDEHVSISRIKG